MWELKQLDPADKLWGLKIKKLNLMQDFTG